MPPRLTLMESLMTTATARAPQVYKPEDEDQDDDGTKNDDDDCALSGEAVAVGAYAMSVRCCTCK